MVLPRELSRVLLFLGVILQALVFVELAGYPYWPETLVILRSVETYLFALLGPLSPLLLILLLYARPLSRLARYASGLSQGFQAVFSWFTRGLRPLLVRMEGFDLAKSSGGIRLLNHPRLLLVAGVAACDLMASFPYWPSWNSSGSLSGVDSPLYRQWFSDMQTRPLNEAVRYAFTGAEFGSRALFLIPTYLIGQLVGAGPGQIVSALPFVLGPLLALATFQFARSAGTGEQTAGLAAVFTGFSFNVTVGIWATYYANWLALVESYLFLAVLLSFRRETSFAKYSSLTILSLLILFTHPWTWVLVLTVSLAFAITLRRKPRKVSTITYIVLLIIISLAADFLKTTIFGAPTIGQDLATKGPMAGLQQLAFFWRNVIDALLYTHSGLMANVAVLGLAAVGVLSLKWKDPFQRLLITWVVVAGAAVAFFESYHQSRIIYDMPFPILSSVGLILLVSGKEHRPLWSSLLLLLGILFTASYVLWSFFVA